MSTEVVVMPIGNGETILLVENDLTILEIGREMLEELRYRVLVAGTPVVPSK